MCKDKNSSVPVRDNKACGGGCGGCGGGGSFMQPDKYFVVDEMGVVIQPTTLDVVQAALAAHLNSINKDIKWFVLNEEHLQNFVLTKDIDKLAFAKEHQTII